MRKKLKRIIVAAVAKNNVIGIDNRIPWISKKELQHFKNLTINSPIIMGSKTYLSIGKVLPQRENIIITSALNLKKMKSDLVFFRSLADAFDYLRSNEHEKVFICGGERIYRGAIKYSEEMIISHMKFEAKGNVIFPNINSALWQTISEKEFNDFIVRHYVRK